MKKLFIFIKIYQNCNTISNIFFEYTYQSYPFKIYKKSYEYKYIILKISFSVLTNIDFIQRMKKRVNISSWSWTNKKCILVYNASEKDKKEIYSKWACFFDKIYISNFDSCLFSQHCIPLNETTNLKTNISTGLVIDEKDYTHFFKSNPIYQLFSHLNQSHVHILIFLKCGDYMAPIFRAQVDCIFACLDLNVPLKQRREKIHFLRRMFFPCAKKSLFSICYQYVIKNGFYLVIQNTLPQPNVMDRIFYFSSNNQNKPISFQLK